jgi:hypothetical protein
LAQTREDRGGSRPRRRRSPRALDILSAILFLEAKP